MALQDAYEVGNYFINEFILLLAGLYKSFRLTHPLLPRAIEEGAIVFYSSAYNIKYIEKFQKNIHTMVHIICTFMQ